MRINRKPSLVLAVLHLAALVLCFTSLPSFGQSAPQRVTLKGTVDVMVEDYKQSAKIRYFLNTATQRLELKFAKNPPNGLLSGTTLLASGTLNGTTLAMDSGSSATSLQTVSTSSSILPNTFGPQSTLVMLVNFQDNPVQPYTVADAYNVMFGSSGSVSDYDLENSYQQTWLTGNVVGWYTIPMNSTTWNCDTGTLMTDANQAATAAGIDVASYAHAIYAFPSSSACNWWGLGTIGGSPQTWSWINGPFETKVVSHEMGHNFGLYHSHAWYCGSTILGSNCSSIEYGDTLDTMGNPSTGHFDTVQKERLGWLNYGVSPPIQTIATNGTYSIGPYENQDGTTKALKILQSTDPNTGAQIFYYVEFRQNIGVFDYWSSDTNVLDGVVVHTGNNGTSDSSELLNMTASTNGCCGTPALDVGQSFNDTSNGITLQTVSASSSGASVSVTFGVPACAHANPSVIFSPSQSQIVMPGTAVSFTVSITNNDNAGCTSSTFNLTTSVPAAWSGTVANSSLTLASGASSSTTMQVTSPISATSGLYTVYAVATNASVTTSTSTGSGIYVLNTTPCIHVNPTLTISPAQTSGLTAGTQQIFQLEIYNKDNSVCTSTTFDISDIVPTGWTSSLGIPWLTIAPGGFAGTYVYVTSPLSASNGSYPIVANVTSSTTSGEASSISATYIIGTPPPRPPVQLTMTLATNASAYTANQTVVITVALMNGTSPVSGASVAFTIVKANGATVNLSGTTGANGVATATYNVKRKDPKGTYSVTASTSGPLGSAQAGTSFIVQ